MQKERRLKKIVKSFVMVMFYLIILVIVMNPLSIGRYLIATLCILGFFIYTLLFQGHSVLSEFEDD